MALLDEELVEYWLNRQGFFCMRGVRVGTGEMDFLAVNPKTREYWHVEVAVSFRPMSYIIGGDNQAKRRNHAEVKQGLSSGLIRSFLILKKRLSVMKLCLL